MKRLLIVALFALTFCFAASAQGLYVGVDAGYGMWSHEPENGTGLDTSNVGLALNVGKAFGAFRVEGSLGYTMAADDDNFEYSNYSVLLNLYYDIELTDAIALYPTVGVGMVMHNAVIDPVLDDTQMKPAFQAGLGARYSIAENQSIDFTARYVAAGEPDYEYDNSIFGKTGGLTTSAIQVALGYKLWF